MNEFKLTNTSKGFTGVRVFNERPSIFFNGTTTTDSFLYSLMPKVSPLSYHHLNVFVNKLDFAPESGQV